MKSLFWAALNLIGFVILVFMSAPFGRKRKEKSAEGHLTADANITAAQKLFGFLQVSVMLFLIFDTGMFLLDETHFPGAKTLHYLFTMLFYITSPLPGFFYLLYCDNKFFNSKYFNKRVFVYFIPVVLNTIAVLLTPFTKLFFYINENNIYTRGSFFWVTVLLSFLYVFSIYPILAIQSKIKKYFAFNKDNLYLFLFPIPPFILLIFQLMNYGILLIGFSFVLSTFLIYINSIQSAEDRQSLAGRFKNQNIIQFAVISFAMMAGMFFVLENVTDKISQDYASFSSSGATHILETHLNKEIGILGTAARSKAITEWLTDDNNIDKKRTAFNELKNILEMLYDDNIYIVAGATGREYSLDKETVFENFFSHGSISEDNPKDKWVFDLMAQTNEYNLNVDIDKLMDRKRVWLNFKVSDSRETIGIICTGMELSILAEHALTINIDNTKTRTFIIDENGSILLDSTMLGYKNFLLYDETKYIKEEITNPDLLIAINAHLDNFDGYFSALYAEVIVVPLYSGRYRYATIAPIGGTSWSLITLFDTSSLFNILNLLPLLLIITAIFVLFTLSSNVIISRLIFNPLRQLVDSLIKMRKNNEQNIFGLERSDEIGLLSNAIQDYFVKGYYDELTGIYNRRYLESALQQIMITLSRTEFNLSVMMIDIDNFKKYNDTYGHDQGDKCLKLVAEALKKTITRKGDFVARYGGEEFTVVLPHSDEEGAKIMAENLLAAVRELKIPHEKSEFEIVTVSIGITTGSNIHSNTRDDYLKKADEALYISKKEGRNRSTICV